MNLSTALHDIIIEHLSAEEEAWYQAVLQKVADSQDSLEEVLNISVLVKRKITSETAISHPCINSSTVSDFVRIALLEKALEVEPELTVNNLVKGYYQAGDSSEKIALLKGLNYIDPQGQTVHTAVRASRCNSLDEFSALAIGNSYPSEHFADLNFNQLVLKTLFMGLDIDELLGLNKRLSVQLSNMCFSYVVEQALAERIPPASIWLAIQYKDLEQEHLSLFTQYVEHFASTDSKHKQVIDIMLAAQSVTLIDKE